MCRKHRNYSAHLRNTNGLANEIDQIVRAIPLNTTATLGRRGFHWRDTFDIVRVTRKMLKRWGVYVIFIRKSNGRVKVYVSSSVAQNGLGNRILGTYERGLQHF